MNWLKEFWLNLKRVKKYSASDPNNFEEKWSFTANRIQLISFLTLISVLFGVLFTFLMIKGPFSGYFSKNDISIERSELENQLKEINKLKLKLDQQEKYIESVQKIISGEEIVDSLNEDVPEVKEIKSSEIETEATQAEKLLSDKVKQDLRTIQKKRQTNLPFFSAPVKGIVSQSYDRNGHLGIDIVTTKDKNVLACLAGTVVYAGYSQKDGNIIILDHSNGFISVYKHNKYLLKKTGVKVQMNDPIAIVGNSGENSTGPHLHFELWFNQNSVNPQDYISFK